MAVNFITNAFCSEIENALDQDKLRVGGTINITSRLNVVSSRLPINCRPIRGELELHRMRGRIAGAILLGVVSGVAANAADFSAGSNVNGGFGVYSPFVARIEPVIVYDFEPGVIVRSYWYPPWQNRHYFPKTGRRPKVGRLEHMPPQRVWTAEEYFRFWSVSSVFAPESPPVPARRYAPAPEQQ
jgi:hypothetical protein